MTNNKNKIFMICLGILLTLSIGYAYLFESISVTGSATANAKFEIEATCIKGISGELTAKGVENFFGLENQNGYSNETCSANDGIVNIDLDLEYPGATRYYTIKFTNKGTIPAQINLEVDNTEGMDIRNKSVINVKNSSGSIIDSKDFSTSGYWTFFEEWTGVMMVGFTTPSGNLIMEDLQEGYVDDNGNILIYPGCSIYGIISAVWDKTDKENNFAATGKFLEYDLSYEFKFKQPTSETINMWDTVIDTL